MRLYYLFAGLIFLHFLPTHLQAASQAERIKDCLLGLLNEDGQAELIADMPKWKTVFSDYVINNAGACYTTLTGIRADFKNGTGLVFDETNIANIEEKRDGAKIKYALIKAQKDAEQKEREDIERKLKCKKSKLFELQRAVYDQEEFFAAVNKELINNLTLKACKDLHIEDANSAILNPICRQAFMKNFHPDIDLRDKIGPYDKLLEAQSSLLTEVFVLQISLDVIDEKKQEASENKVLADVLEPCE